MPFKTMPKEAFALWEKVYNDAKAKGDSDETAAKKAYGALRRAGWKQNEDGMWIKGALQEFSLRIEKASLDKSTLTRRWRAVASDTDTDLYDDNMTLQLFRDFIERIDSHEPVPEEFKSDFWEGGLPYLSISHYPDLNGKAVPGMTDSLYIDGKFFKAKGHFLDTPLGNACFNAVCEDLYSTQPSKHDDKIRISIAFLDYAHRHKKSGYVFERSDIEHDFCPECLREALTGETYGKEFLRGHLIHLALTRVPVNPRTVMEVEKAMVKTRIEDAASIIGEDLAKELDEEAKLVGKSQALVIKSDEPETEPEEVQKAVTKKEDDCEHPASHYLIVEDAEHPATWHLRIRDCNGELDHHLMGAAWAALHEGFRGNKYEGSHKEEALHKLRQLYEEEGLELPSETSEKALLDEISKLHSELEDLKSLVGVSRSEPPAREEHPLDKMFSEFKSSFDAAITSEKSANDKISAIHAAYEKFGGSIAEYITLVTESQVQEPENSGADMVQHLSRAMASALEPVMQKLDLLVAQMSTTSSDIRSQVPTRRSVAPSMKFQADISPVYRKPAPTVSTSTPKLRAIIEKTT